MVDALVSNTSNFTVVSVRPRSWVQKRNDSNKKETFRFFYARKSRPDDQPQRVAKFWKGSTFCFPWKMFFSTKSRIVIPLICLTNTFYKQQIRFLREFLLLNKDIKFIHSMFLNPSGVTWGSIVPHLEEEITRIEQVIDMIKGLPNPLDYKEHIEYYERSSEGVKKHKKEELKRNFMDSD